MLAWLRRGAEAAQLAGDRSDLWPAGALAWLAWLGWLPLLLVLANPHPADLEFFGVSLYMSSAFPFNVGALALAAVGIFAMLCLLAAVAEVALLRWAGAGAQPGGAYGRRPGSPSLGRAALTAFTITLVSSLPAAAAATALVTGAISVVPAVFLSPDIETPVVLRLAAQLLPYLLLLIAAILLGQAFGGIAIRRAQAAPGEPIVGTLAASARILVRRPWPRVGVAATGMLVDAVSLIFTLALLRVLWAPIATSIADGRLLSPGGLLLLLGFVTIWLALLLVAGALHVAVSAWWAVELARGHRGEAD